MHINAALFSSFYSNVQYWDIHSKLTVFFRAKLQKAANVWRPHTAFNLFIVSILKTPKLLTQTPVAVLNLDLFLSLHPTVRYRANSDGNSWKQPLNLAGGIRKSGDAWIILTRSKIPAQ